MSVAHEDVDRLSPTERPNGRAAGYQDWRELLFLHWRISPAEMAPLVPESLSIDTCEGRRVGRHCPLSDDGSAALVVAIDPRRLRFSRNERANVCASPRM